VVLDNQTAFAEQGDSKRYAAVLAGQGPSASNINQRLSAIRKLATEAAGNGAVPEQIANGIKNVKGLWRQGTRHKSF